MSINHDRYEIELENLAKQVYEYLEDKSVQLQGLENYRQEDKQYFIEQVAAMIQRRIACI